MSGGIFALACGLLVSCQTPCPTTEPSLRAAFLAAYPSSRIYQVQVGDRLRLEVWQNPQLSKEVLVQPDGQISLPLVGRVKVVGLSLDALQDHLRQKLQSIVPDAVVWASVREFQPQTISVQGQVHRSGSYPLARGDSFLDVLAKAGGATEKAQCVLIVRRQQDKSLLYQLSLNPLLNGSSLQHNIPVAAKDLVIVQ